MLAYNLRDAALSQAAIQAWNDSGHGELKSKVRCNWDIWGPLSRPYAAHWKDGFYYYAQDSLSVWGKDGSVRRVRVEGESPADESPLESRKVNDPLHGLLAWSGGLIELRRNSIYVLTPVGTGKDAETPPRESPP